MHPILDGATAARGGLRARTARFFAHPAVHRVSALVVGLSLLGALGQCLAVPSAPAAQSSATGPPAVAASSITVAGAAPALAPAPSASVASSPSLTSATLATVAASDAGVVGVVDVSAPPFTSAKSGASLSLDAPIDLNAASAEDLKRLPGIGPKRANAILELRAKLGGFKRLEDIQRVRGIGRAAVKRLRPLVAIGPSPPRP